MTDKEYYKQKKRIQDLVDKWIGPSGFKWWQINLEYSRQFDSDDHEQHAYSTTATTHVRWPYHKADITFYMPVVAETDDNELENVFVHELAHLLIAPVIDEDTDQEKHEYATECIAKALIWTKGEIYDVSE